MTLPLNLVLVRHGDSEGNAAIRQSKAGDESAYTDEFRSRHNSTWRLTDLGCQQADAARDWLQANSLTSFHRMFVSEYVRALETALRLELAGPWYLEYYLRERDRGPLDSMPYRERRERIAAEYQRRRMHPFYDALGGLESRAHQSLRTDLMLGMLHRRCSRMNVLIVGHSSVLRSFRGRIERMSSERMRELEHSEDPRDHIHNCQIFHFTRVNPMTGVREEYVNWMRSICPWDPSRSWNEWREIVRPQHTRDDLRQIVERYPRMIAG